MNQDSHFIYFLSLIWMNKVKLIAANMIVAILAVIYLLLQPNWYKSSVTVLVENDSNSLNLAATISEMVPFGFGGFGQNENILRYLRLLNSRTMSDKVIDNFDLHTAYDIEFRSEVYNALSENTVFVDNEDGSFTIVCMYEEDPVKAAEMANFYYRELVEKVAEIDRELAGSYREFVEHNYDERVQVRSDLGEQMKSYQESTGIIEINAQIKSVVNTIAELEFEKIKAEIELEVLKKGVQADHPKITQFEQAVAIYQQKINQVKRSNQYTNIAYQSIPEQGLEYLGLLRDYKIEEKLTEYLALQLEQAKLEESRNTSNLFLLDEAVPSDKKFRPTRSTKLILIMIFSGSFSLIIIRVREYYKLKKPEFDSYLG